MHHIIVNSWEHGVDAEQNVVLVSIASVADPSLAPEGARMPLWLLPHCRVCGCTPQHTHTHTISSPPLSTPPC